MRQKRREGEKALNAALKSISSNSEDALWVRLDECMIEDHHISRLCAALENNTRILSLDLSGNQITDEGVFQICDCLAQGAAPDLIELNMRNIMIESDGEKSIANLMKMRKVLRVDVSAPQNASGKEGLVATEESEDSKESAERSSSLVQNIFQMGNGETIEGLSEEDSHRMDIEDECFRLWEEVSTCVWCWLGCNASSSGCHDWKMIHNNLGSTIGVFDADIFVSDSHLGILSR